MAKARDIYIPKPNNPNMCYFLGFLTADGSLSKRSVEFQIQERDKPLLRKMVDWALFLGWTFSADERHTEQGDYIRVRINSVKLVRVLRSRGFDTRNQDIQYSEYIPDTLARDYIRGFFDGDGTVYLKKKRAHLVVEFSNGSENFLTDLNNKLSVLLDIDSKTVRFHQRAYQFALYSNEAIKFLEFIYSGNPLFYLPRKKNVYKDFKHVT